MPAAFQAVDNSFQDALRDALNHLYDPDRLRTSALVQLLELHSHPQATHKLQQLLLDAIQTLRPPPGEPATSGKRRIYQILQLRYEQQYAQKEVAIQLGLSVRQYRRLQHAALQALTYQLSDQYGVAVLDTVSTAARAPSMPARSPDVLSDALQWMTELAPDEVTHVAQVLPDVARLVQPLADRHGKQLRLEGDLGTIAAIHPQICRQALLHLLNFAILRSAGQDVVMRVEADQWQVAITIDVQGIDVVRSAPAAGIVADVEIVRQMLDYCGGQLRVGTSPAREFTQIVCRTTTERTILAVDDHEDTLELLKRYVVATRYGIVTCRNPEMAIEMAHLHLPNVVVLDVMMPNIDGWEILTRLKQAPATAYLPILVCTVLEQSELALSLGADGFLRKPFSRQEFLSMLETHVRGPVQALR